MKHTVNHTVTIGSRTFALTLALQPAWGGSHESQPEAPEIDVLAIHEGGAEVHADAFDANLAASVPDTDAWWAELAYEVDREAREKAADAMERSGFCDG
jgi:hypothetical protein